MIENARPIRKLKNSAKHLWLDRRGAQIAELAIILPAVLILLFGMFDFAFLLYQKQLVTKSVQDAARFAARSTTVISNGVCPPSSAGWSSTVAQAQQIAIRGTSNGAVMLSNFSANDVTVSVSCPAAGIMNTSNPVSGTIPIVTVSAQIQARSLGVLGILGFGPLVLSAEHSEFGVGL